MMNGHLLASATLERVMTSVPRSDSESQSRLLLVSLSAYVQFSSFFFCTVLFSVTQATQCFHITRSV